VVAAPSGCEKCAQAKACGYQDKVMVANVGERLLLYQMQPVDEKKLGSADKKGDSCHHGITKGCPKRNHNKPDAQTGGEP